MPNRFEDILTAFWHTPSDEAQQAIFAALEQEQSQPNIALRTVLTDYLQAVVHTACALHKTDTEENILLERLAHLQTLPEFGEHITLYAQHIFKSTPDDPLRFLENFSTEHTHLQSHKNPEFLVRLGAENASETFYFRYDLHTQNHTQTDLYSGQNMPINGDPEVCGYDTYLPMHRILGRHFPEAGVQLGITQPGPYIYVITFQYFKHYTKSTGDRGLDFLPAAFWDDLRTNRAILCINDTFEAADYTDIFPLYTSILQKRGVYKNVFIFSGDPSNEAIYERFKARMNRKPWWKPTSPPLPFSFFAFRLFEEAMAETQRMFYADYTLEHRLQVLRQANEVRPFLCFNRIVKDYRVVASYLFFKRGLLDKTYISQDHFVDESSFRFGHNAHKALFTLTEPEAFETFRQSLPWYVDTDNFVSNPWNVLPMHILNRSFLWVVTETDFGKGDKTVFFITEKTYKPMLVFMPFVIIGNPYTLQSLQNEGYQTFSRWWDESYDQETDPVKRMAKIFDVLTELARLTTEQWLTLLHEMREVLQHNHDRLLKARSSQPAMHALANAYRTLSV